MGQRDAGLGVRAVAAAALIATIMLAGCGGGDAAPPEQTYVPTSESTTTSEAPRLHPRDEAYLEGVTIDVSAEGCKAAVRDLAFGETESIGKRQLVTLASCPSPDAWAQEIRDVGPRNVFSISTANAVNIEGVNENLCGSARGWGILPGCARTAGTTSYGTFDGLSWK
jgi:hypothetical protein